MKLNSELNDLAIEYITRVYNDLRENMTLDSAKQCQGWLDIALDALKNQGAAYVDQAERYTKYAHEYEDKIASLLAEIEEYELSAKVESPEVIAKMDEILKNLTKLTGRLESEDK